MAEGRRRRENNSEDEESNLESGSPSLRRSRRRSSTSRNQRNRSEGEESESASYSGSDSPSRSRRRKSSSRRRRNRSEDDGEESDTDSGSDSRRRRRSRRKSRGKSVDSSESESEEERSRMKRKITEEEIIEYMAKKSQKKALKVAKNLKSQAVSGYSNDSNPFGDSNLGEKFVWRKKIERDVVQGRQLDISVRAEKKKQKERMAEIEKMKKRREERAIEKAQHEEEMALLARERARAEFQDWEKREEEFNFYQSKIRSQIRLHEGRMKPIDILSKNLNDSDEFDIEINEPYTMFTGLTVKEMEELHDDIKMHIDSDRATATHIEFWEAMMVVCNWELAEARKRDALDRARVRGEEPPPEILAEERGLHSSIEADVKRLLEGKTSSELEAMRCQIESQMRLGTAKVVEYWEAVLKRLQIYKEKARLKEIHADLLRKHLERLQHPMETEQEVESDKEKKTEEDDMDGDQQFYPQIMTDESMHKLEEEPGSFSPQLLHTDEDEDAIDPESDQAVLDREREAVQRIQGAMAAKAAAPDELEVKAMKVMGAMVEGDAVLGSDAEVNLDSQGYWWHDKYRPRKPKYFNRVHTGYEWNKSNQTHYDHDNPPPKIVQGYKFHIFYPDLVDKSKAPTYTIEKDGNGETCIIKFHAGPPYEDIDTDMGSVGAQSDDVPVGVV